MATRLTITTRPKKKSYTAQEVLDLFATLEVDPSWAFIYCKPSDTNKLTHGYHRYPAKFIPQIVERLFDEYLGDHREAHVNDLFMGSGTTIACAITKGYYVSGTDINKTAYLITRAKSTPIEPTYLGGRVQAVITDLESSLEESLFKSFTKIEPYLPQQNTERIDYWFAPDTKEQLGTILARIYAEGDEKVKTFLLCGFSHILKTCSRWLMGSSKPTVDKNKTPALPLQAFKAHLKKMLKGNKAFYETTPLIVRDNIDKYLTIKCQDARSQPCEDNSVDIQITSSPYVTSYEYADLHQLTTLWLEHAKNLREYRKDFIGTAYFEWEDHFLSSQIAQNIVDQLTARDRSMAQEVSMFFYNMEESFKETYRILKPGGRACYVIGNTTLRGVDILNAEVFAETMQAVGFEIDRVIKREIPSKILPQTRDKKTGKFTNNHNADFHAYPVEYIVIGLKEGKL